MVSNIKGIEEAMLVDGVHKVNVMVKAGKDYRDAIDNSGRFAYVVASALDAKKARFACEQAISKISIELFQH